MSAAGLELARLIAAQMALHAGMAGLRMAAPLLALQQGGSVMAVGLLLSLFAVTQMCMAVPAGRLVDRAGLHRPVALAVVLASAGAAAAALWPVFAVLCAAALATGAATGLMAIAVQRHVGRMGHSALALKQAFGWLSLGPAVSNVVGPLAAGVLIDHGGRVAADVWGFQLAFGLMAALPLLAWGALAGVAAPAPVAAHAQQVPGRVWDVLRLPGMCRLLLVSGSLSACWDVHTFVVPILGHERGLSASQVGAVLAAFAVAAALVRASLHWLARHRREHEVITLAMLATALLFGLYPFMGTVWGMAVCSALLGLVLGSVQPMVMSSLHHITPAHRQGEALGLRLMSVNATSVALPTLFGVATAAVGVSAVFWVVGAGVGLGARWAWQLQHLPQAPQPAAPQPPAPQP